MLYFSLSFLFTLIFMSQDLRFFFKLIYPPYFSFSQSYDFIPLLLNCPFYSPGRICFLDTHPAFAGFPLEALSMGKNSCSHFGFLSWQMVDFSPQRSLVPGSCRVRGSQSSRGMQLRFFSFYFIMKL